MPREYIYISSETVFRTAGEVLQIANRIRTENRTGLQYPDVFNQTLPVALFYGLASFDVRLDQFSVIIRNMVHGVHFDRSIRKIIQRIIDIIRHSSAIQTDIDNQIFYIVPIDTAHSRRSKRL